jgi:uncharacterized protein (DUF433 family)
MGRTLNEVIKTLPKSRRVRVMNRYPELQRGLKYIVSDPAVMGGEPVFAGTRIPLAHIAGTIAQGAPLHEIAADYPHLSRADLHFAAIHSRMNRAPKRPRKALRFVRVSATAARSKARPKNSSDC